ncbi:MAG: TonB family protein [Thiohalocapsa sp.]|uniref:energy transducer TonB family protein n=1 Tax=Thiohalocapsa sp. TaxID=2497641 RepID=UPI0025D4AFD9|nr:TonB family protein [Thiohalocapsa sp.]MCG6940310.1 TonB family protein [Thiohalocapsa sp.]
MDALKPSPATNDVRTADETTRGTPGAWPMAIPVGITTSGRPSEPASAVPQPPAPARNAAARRSGLWLALALSLLIHGCLLAAAQWLPAPWLPRAPAARQPQTPRLVQVVLIDAGLDAAGYAAPSDTDAATPAQAATAPATPSPTAEPPRTPPAQPVAKLPEPPPSPGAAHAPPLRTESPAPAASPNTATRGSAAASPATKATERTPSAPKRNTAQAPAASAPAKPARQAERSPETRPPAPLLAAPAPRPAPPEPKPAQRQPVPGLAALDAEIAAARRQRDAASPAPAPPPAPSSRGTADARAGLAALDAEIAASHGRGRAHDQRPDRADSAGHGNGHGNGHAAPRAHGGSRQQTDPAARGRAERRYLSALRHALERERHYPLSARRRRLEGTARVQFTIAANGAFSAIHVSHGAGDAALDEAAAATVRRLARFEPIPAVIGRSRWTVRVPIVFRLN